MRGTTVFIMSMSLVRDSWSLVIKIDFYGRRSLELRIRPVSCSFGHEEG